MALHLRVAPIRILFVILLALLILGSSSCVSRQPVSHPYNLLGWPARGLLVAGDAGAGSGIPVVRELGRLGQAVGELVDGPALVVEGVATLRPQRLVDGGVGAVQGTGATLTAAWNVAFFWVPGGTIDIGADAELVNDALVAMESVPPERWRLAGDEREFIFPPGTRVYARGRALVYTIPGQGEVLQVAESNLLWHALQALTGTSYPAQERSWGFIVRTSDRWWQHGPRQRAITILHEFYHQEMQMRARFHRWTTLYWPAYLATFPFTGWSGHWAEMRGGMAAGVVDRSLARWNPASWLEEEEDQPQSHRGR